MRLTFEQAFHGTEVELDLSVLESDAQGVLRRVPRRIHVRIPKGVSDGQQLRIPGKGGKGVEGGRDGDLYLDIVVESHPWYRVSGQDIYLDLPLAPWEAVLGTTVRLPTPAGAVSLKVPPGNAGGPAAAARRPRAGAFRRLGGQPARHRADRRALGRRRA